MVQYNICITHAQAVWLEWIGLSGDHNKVNKNFVYSENWKDMFIVLQILPSWDGNFANLIQQ